MPRRLELALTVAVLLAAAAATWEVGVRGTLAPLLEQRARLREKLIAVRAQKRWIRERETATAALKVRLDALANLASELDPYMLREEDRLRLPQARDRAATALGDHLLSPESTGAPPERFTSPAPADPNEHLDKLRGAFLKQNPRAVFDAWRVPPEIDVLRYQERFALECSYAGLFSFLARLDADPLLVEVTELKASGFRTERGERVSATIELSGFGWDDEASSR